MASATAKSSATRDSDWPLLSDKYVLKLWHKYRKQGVRAVRLRAGVGYGRHDRIFLIYSDCNSRAIHCA